MIQIIHTLARQIRTILLVPIILSSLSIFYVFLIAKPVYRSTSKIISSSSNVSGVSQAAGLAAQFGINIPTGQSEPKWVYPEIIKSRALAREVLQRKFNTVEFGPQKQLLQILTYGNEEPKIQVDTLQVYGVNTLLGMIEVYENPRTGILTLSVDAFEASLSAEINKVLIDELDEHQSKYNKSKTSEAKAFIQGRIIDTEKELIAAEEDLKVFMDRNRRIENSPALQLEQQRLSREVTVLTGVFTTLKQQLETTKIEEVKESDYVIVIDPPEIPLNSAKPKKKIIVLLAGISGLIFGLIIAFVKEFISNSKIEEKEKMKKAKTELLKNLSKLIPKRFR